jgi:hypothetical protein
LRDAPAEDGDDAGPVVPGIGGDVVDRLLDQVRKLGLRLAGALRAATACMIAAARTYRGGSPARANR